MYEKIKAEIERRLKANGSFDEGEDSVWHYNQGMIEAYKSIGFFIESLEKEEQSPEYVLQNCVNGKTYYYKVVGKDGNNLVIDEYPEGSYRVMTEIESNFFSNLIDKGKL